MTRTSKRDKAILVKKFLDLEYGKVETFLKYDKTKPWQLLLCVILSAQATDQSVNKVTPLLFEKYPTLQDLSKADYSQVESLIKSIGLAKNKAKFIIQTSSLLLNKYHNEIPLDRQELMTLPGVGYKTSGVVLGELYDFPYIPVDTHVETVAIKLGFVKQGTNVKQIEKELEKDFKGLGDLINTHKQLILFGRRVCRPSTDPKVCWDYIFHKLGMKE